MINRRQFLNAAAAAATSWNLPSVRAENGRPKAPFRLLYGNDTTNIEECVSPFHKRGEPFTPAMLEASVDEAADAGCDAQLLQPGLTWVPLWKSNVYPADDHFRWFHQTFGVAPAGLSQYMIDGGDVVQVFARRCRARGVASIISVRLNDYHRVEFLDTMPGQKLSHFDSLAVDRFRREHPEYRIRTSPVTLPTSKPSESEASKAWFDTREGNVMNWAIPQVRQRMLAFITEIATNYDVDGIELDFLRHFRFFRLNETSREQRAQIITEFVGQVRRVLDSPDRHRWLGVRVPGVLALHDPLGIDLAAMQRAGVDMINLSSNYYTVQQGLDLAPIRALVPDLAVYLEMTQCTSVGGSVGTGHGDNFVYRLTTAEQFQTTANLAYARGLDGVSLYNFAYYREYGNPKRGPFFEPPFDVLKGLTDRQELAQLPQHYFIAPVWRSPYENPIQLPRGLKRGTKITLHLDMAAPPTGWTQTGRLRLQFDQPCNGDKFRVKMNDVELPASDDISEPYPAKFPKLLGTPETLRAFQTPASCLITGINRLDVTMDSGDQAKLLFVDLAIA